MAKAHEGLGQILLAGVDEDRSRPTDHPAARQAGRTRRKAMTAWQDFTPQHFNWRMEAMSRSSDRPERKNPLTFESYAELRDTFRALVYADDVKAVVILPGGNFCSGGDVHDIIGPLTDAT
jgi:1,4-dihydroxy-2-naphthoyl-CoA synthase